MALYCVSGGECTGCGNCIGEAEAVFECVLCGNDIYEGDMYYNVAGEKFCEECVRYEEA